MFISVSGSFQWKAEVEAVVGEREQQSSEQVARVVRVEQEALVQQAPPVRRAQQAQLVRQALAAVAAPN
jgi:hypothetical protein